MQDPKFEKQVQQKMEELKFSPSDVVWANIDAEINPEKKRRKPFFWLFFLLGLSIAAGGYFIINNSNKQTGFKVQGSSKQEAITGQETSKQKKLSGQDATREQVATDQKEATEKKETSEQANVAGKKNTIKKLIPGNESGKNKTAGTANATDHSLVNVQHKRSGPLTHSKNTFIISKKDKEKKTSQEKNEHVTTAIDDDIVKTNPGISNDHQQKRIDNKNDVNHLKDSSASSTAINIPDKKQAVGTAKKQAVNDSLNTKNKIAKANDKKKHAWKIGFMVDPGVSGIAGGLFKSAYLNVTPAPVYSSTVSPINANATRTTATPLTMDFSFAAGVLARTNLSKRVSFSAGINYHYYSVKTVVGKYVDTSRTLFLPQLSTVPNYYGDSAVSNYTNHYHFIELPLLLSFQLNKNVKKPVLWQAGLSLSYLIATNALQHDESSHVYYKDNGLFNKMQVVASTGLLFGCNAGKNQLQIGPEIQYGLTRLLNKSANYPEHLFFGGIKVVWMRK